MEEFSKENIIIRQIRILFIQRALKIIWIGSCLYKVHWDMALRWPLKFCTFYLAHNRIHKQAIIEMEKNVVWSLYENKCPLRRRLHRPHQNGCKSPRFDKIGCRIGCKIMWSKQLSCNIHVDRKLVEYPRWFLDTSKVCQNCALLLYCEYHHE